MGGVVGDSLLARFRNVEERFIARNDFSHPRFNRGKVGFSERHFAVDIVEETAVGRGTVAELRLGEELEDGRGHDVGGGVAYNFERGGVGLLEKLEGDIFGERLREVDDAGFTAARMGGVHGLFACLQRGFVYGSGSRSKRRDPCDNDSCRETRRDAAGDVERGCAAGDFADRTVRKLDLNLVVHQLSRIEHQAG